MDTKDLLKGLLSSTTTSAIAKESKTTDTDVKSVLTSAIPNLISGKMPSAAETKAVSSETGIDAGKVSSIFNAALPYVKDILKNVDTKEIEQAVSKLATPENLKKAAGLAGKFLKNRK